MGFQINKNSNNAIMQQLSSGTQINKVADDAIANQLRTQADSLNNVTKIKGVNGVNKIEQQTDNQITDTQKKTTESVVNDVKGSGDTPGVVAQAANSELVSNNKKIRDLDYESKGITYIQKQLNNIDNQEFLKKKSGVYNSMDQLNQHMINFANTKVDSVTSFASISATITKDDGTEVTKSLNELNFSTKEDRDEAQLFLTKMQSDIDSQIKALEKQNTQTVENTLASMAEASAGMRINTVAAQATVTNVNGQEAPIRDVDFAAESANFSKMNILAQAGVAALAQAHANPQIVKGLLQ